MGALIFLVAFMLYAYSAVPLIFYEDNPEFITTAYTLGVSHPSGYPLINMLGNLAGLAPYGSFAYRCNLMSAFFGAVAVYLFYRCAVLLIKSKRLSISATLLFLFSGNLWTQATIMEVYTLHYALFFGILYISLSGRLADYRWLLASSFLFGLGVTNHLSFSLSLVPFTILWLGWKEEWCYSMNAGKWIILLSTGLMSWGIQLYLLARSSSSAGLDKILFSWGKVESLSFFIANITGSVYSGDEANSGSVLERLDIFGGYLSTVSLWSMLLLLLIFIIGGWKMFKENRSAFAALTIGITLFTFYMLIQYAAVDILAVIPWGLSLLIAGYGLDKIKILQNDFALTSLMIAPLFLLPVSFLENDRHADYSAYNYITDIIDTVPKNGILGMFPGFPENYIFQFALLGPLSDSLNKEGDMTEYYPYASLSPKTKESYGLLYSNIKRSKEENRKVWRHIRSLNIDNQFKSFSGGELTRDSYKGITLSRAAIQKALHYGSVNWLETEKAFLGIAASYSVPTVISEASVRLSRGEKRLAEKMLEAVINNGPSTKASMMLARIRIAKK